PTLPWPPGNWFPARASDVEGISLPPATAISSRESAVPGIRAPSHFLARPAGAQFVPENKSCALDREKPARPAELSLPQANPPPVPRAGFFQDRSAPARAQ